MNKQKQLQPDTQANTPAEPPVVSPQRAQPLSKQNFQTLGMNVCAYIRPTIIDGQTIYAIHHADGSQIALYEDRDEAFACIILNGLKSTALH